MHCIKWQSLSLSLSLSLPNNYVSKFVMSTTCVMYVMCKCNSTIRELDYDGNPMPMFRNLSM